MSSVDRNARVRAEAMLFLERERAVRGEVLERRLLEQGFQFEGERVPLLGPQGIFKPRLLDDAPLSITTAPVVAGKARPYEDAVEDSGFVVYRYRDSGPDHHENRGLRRAMSERIPLIYFKGIVQGRYLPAFPAFIVGDDREHQAFRVQLDVTQVLTLPGFDGKLDPSEDRRAYVTRTAVVRMHQREFRDRVIAAYRSECAVCKLKHTELLDAAHIIPDKDPRGLAVVPNGLALCKLHHAAFDQHILGIRPDKVIEINRTILEEIDGPMLKHGLQGFHQQKIQVPRAEGQRPRPEFLEVRYEMFRRSA